MDSVRPDTTFINFVEKQSPDLAIVTTLTDIRFKQKSQFQDIQVVDLLPFGKTLILDSKTQSSQVDEKIYHETLVHPAMLACSNPKTVFIGGGGELATAREVLRHSLVERVVMVDLDEVVVQVSRKELPEWGDGAMEDTRLEVYYEDAKAYLENHQDKFDVVIMDIADPIEAGPGIILYTKEFYQFVKEERMNPGGVLVTQSGSSGLLYYHECFTVINKTLSSVFSDVLPYSVEIPSFGSSWGFNLCIMEGSLKHKQWSAVEVDEMVKSRLLKEKNSLFHYDGESHIGMFHIPKFLRKAIEAEKTIMTKDNMVSMY